MSTETIVPSGPVPPEHASGAAAGARGTGRLPGWVAVAALTALAALLRLPTLSLQSFWLDEGYTMRLLRMPLAPMISAIGHSESTPYLYYALAWVWTRAFGFGEFGVRSLSALAGIATVPVVYAATRRLGGRRAAAIAGLLVAISPMMVWFSQEARAYALATLLSSLTVLCLVGYCERGRTPWLVGWVASAALGLASHYFLAFVIAPELIWLWRRAPRDRRLLIAVGVVAVVGCALVPLAIAQQRTGHADYIAHTSLATTLIQIPKQLLVGYASPGQRVTAVLAGLLMLGGAVTPLALCSPVRARAQWPLIVGVAAVLVPVALALLGIDFLDTRNLLPALAPLIIAAAIGFDGWRELAAQRGRSAAAVTGVVAAVALALVGVLVIVLVDANPRYQRDDWRGVARALGRAPADGRVLIVDPASGEIPLQAYMSGLHPLRGPEAVRELDVVVVPANVRGAGVGTPPRPTTHEPVPPGFTPAGVDTASTYTVLRYRAARPIAVGPSVARARWLGRRGLRAIGQSGTPAR